MAKATKTIEPKNIDEYIQLQPEEVQVALQRLRGAIRKAAPDAEEVIWRPAVQSETDVKIELLKSCDSPRAATVENLARPSVVGIVADILHEQVARRP